MRPRLKTQRSHLKTLVLLAVTAVIMTTVFVSVLDPTKTRKVADAQARLKRVNAEVAAAARVLNSADAAARRMAGAHSPANLAIQSVGKSVFHELGIEKAQATAEVVFARRIAAADYCIQTYESYDQAQQAMATLNLAGIDEVVIRPTSNIHTRDPGVLFGLMVPHSLTNQAAVALESTRITELTRFADGFQGAGVLQRLANRGIHATIRPVERVQGHKEAGLDWVVYVQPADENSAKVSLNESPGLSAEKF